MAGMRVHELAKEFGMTSKELVERLKEMKIPVKNHASTRTSTRFARSSAPS